MTTALQIERRALGRSELIIPRVALGCGNFGGVGSTPELFGEGFSEEQALTTKTYNPMHAGGDRGLAPDRLEWQLQSSLQRLGVGYWLTGKYRRGEPFPPGSRMTQRPEPYQQLLTDRAFDALERLAAFAHERGTSIAATALAWLLAHPRVAQIVICPGRPEHLATVGEALERPLSPEEKLRVEALL